MKFVLEIDFFEKMVRMAADMVATQTFPRVKRLQIVFDIRSPSAASLLLPTLFMLAGRHGNLQWLNVQIARLGLNESDFS